MLAHGAIPWFQQLEMHAINRMTVLFMHAQTLNFGFYCCRCVKSMQDLHLLSSRHNPLDLATFPDVASRMQPGMVACSSPAKTICNALLSGKFVWIKGSPTLSTNVMIINTASIRYLTTNLSIHAFISHVTTHPNQYYLSYKLPQNAECRGAERIPSPIVLQPSSRPSIKWSWKLFRRDESRRITNWIPLGTETCNSTCCLILTSSKVRVMSPVPAISSWCGQLVGQLLARPFIFLCASVLHAWFIACKMAQLFSTHLSEDGNMWGEATRQELYRISSHVVWECVYCKTSAEI